MKYIASTLRVNDMKIAWEMEKLNREIGDTNRKILEAAYQARLANPWHKRLYYKIKYKSLSKWRECLYSSLKSMEKENPVISGINYVTKRWGV